jgi:hypothetical protein
VVLGLTVDQDEVTDALYIGLPENFVRARDEAAREASDAGHRKLAAAIGKLRKPTAGAWLANLLVHNHAAEVAELRQLGSAMRDAQTQLDGETLRTLSRRRPQLVAELVRLARGAADDAGRAAGEAAVHELEGTLGAVLADPEAAAMLTSGRLTTGLSYAGFGGPSLKVAAPPKTKPKAVTTDTTLSDRVDAAERELAQARLQGAHSEAEAQAAGQRVIFAAAELDSMTGRITELRAELAATERALAAKQEELSRAETERDTAEAALAESSQLIGAAEQWLDHLLG